MEAKVRKVLPKDEQVRLVPAGTSRFDQGPLWRAGSRILLLPWPLRWLWVLQGRHSDGGGKVGTRVRSEASTAVLARGHIALTTAPTLDRSLWPWSASTSPSMAQ